MLLTVGGWSSTDKAWGVCDSYFNMEEVFMVKKESRRRGQDFRSPAGALQAIAGRARHIRKLLRRVGKRVDRRAWGALRDAERIADAVEAIASRSVDLPAEGAITAVEMLEVLMDQLEAKVAFVLAR